MRCSRLVLCYSVSNLLFQKKENTMRITAAILAAMLFSVSARGVTPQTWLHANEADFAEGEFDATVVTSLGELRLARQVTLLVGAEQAPPVVSAVVAAGEDVYAADGSEAKVYRVSDGKAELLAELPGAMVCSLLWTGDELLAGTGGESGGVYRVSSAGEVQRVWSEEGVGYVWAMLRRDGTLYAATGPNGRVFAIGANGQAETVYDAGDLASNILCLAPGEGALVAGTDQSGLVVWIDPAARTSRVILDAEESEIAALVVDGKGGVFAATADAGRAASDGDGTAAPPRGGRAVPADVPDEAGPPQEDGEPEPVEEEDAEEATEHEESGEAVGAVAPGEAPQLARDVSKADRLAELSAVLDGAPATVRPAQATTRPAVGANVAADELAEEDGEGDEDGQAARQMAMAAMRARMRGAAVRRGGGGDTGNAVYYIRPDGLVETRFRRPVTILAMLPQDGGLLLGTGNGGGLYRISADGDESAQLADTEARQVTSLAAADDGRVLFATANKGSVGVLGEKPAAAGRYVSPVLDAAQMSRWGTAAVRARMSVGTGVTIATRSGNVEEADEATWSEWSNAQPADGFSPLGSPAARFLQYRLELTGDGERTPAVRQVEIIYQAGNLPPTLSSVDVEPSEKGARPNITTGGAKAFRHVQIDASDPNEDALRFQIDFRRAGEDLWVPCATELDEPKFVWDTRTVGDGAYELRVRASDVASNPPATALAATRVSNLVTVDNTPPVVGPLNIQPTVDGPIVSGEASDAGSRIVEIAYSVDSQEDWTVVAPEDHVCDSERETFRFELRDAESGPHRVAVKVTDLYGNTAYGSMTAVVVK